MKLAFISDIHGNVPALEVVLEHLERFAPDQVFVNGDIVNRGPCSAKCWAMIQRRVQDDGYLLTRGNHEDYVAQHLSPNDKRSGLVYEINQLSYWTFRQMGSAAKDLPSLPERISIGLPLDGFARTSRRELRVCHASMRSNTDGLFPINTDEELRPKIHPAPHIFMTAHSHIGFIRQVDQTLIINSGAVGSPCDGDVRASYAQLSFHRDGPKASLVRLNYDRERAKQSFFDTGFLEESGPISKLIYYEWRRSAPLVQPWMRKYRQAVLDQKISLQSAVEAHLHETGALL